MSTWRVTSCRLSHPGFEPSVRVQVLVQRDSRECEFDLQTSRSAPDDCMRCAKTIARRSCTTSYSDRPLTHGRSIERYTDRTLMSVDELDAEIRKSVNRGYSVATRAHPRIRRLRGLLLLRWKDWSVACLGPSEPVIAATKSILQIFSQEISQIALPAITFSLASRLQLLQ